MPKRTRLTHAVHLSVVLASLLVTVCGVGQQPVPPAASSSESQPEVATLRVTSRTVEISAVVRNKTGEPQNALQKDDFILKEDGKEQPIHYFSVGSDLPLTLALLVDVSGSQRTFIGDEWRASDVFFESMLTSRQDRAVLVEIDARIQPLMGLTNSVSSLHLALTQLGFNNSTAGRTRLDDGIYLVTRDFLAGAKGRKAMILLSDGGENGSQHTLDEAIAQAQRADVAIYGILYSGWVGQDYDFRQGLSTLRNGQADPGAAFLKKLTEATGGRVYTVARGMPLKKIYEAIGADLRTQYELGYTPPSDLQPNSFHKLEVKAKDKKLTVQARNGFYVQP